jgi:DNA-binding transcriptional regulator YdaS (Cro superfamily)
MTPADLRVLCDSLNDERGTGGQSKLARLLGCHYSTVWRKPTGKSPVKQAYELAIRQAVRSLRNCPELARLAEKWRKNESAPVSQIVLSNAEDRS